MAKKLQYILNSIFAVWMILVSGCSTVQKVEMSPESRQRIKNVYIDKIKYPEIAGCFSQEAATAGIFFGISGRSIASDRETKEMTQFVKDNNIHIDQIVRKQFEEQIPRKTAFKISDKKDSDADLMIEIKGYGMATVSAFHKPKPHITIEVKLVSKDNKILWQAAYYGNSDFSGLSKDEIKADPSKLYTALNAAAEKAVAELVKEM